MPSRSPSRGPTSSRRASTCASARSPTGSAAASCPDTQTVEQKVKDYIIDELDLHRDGVVLETNRPYLIPLKERLALPPDVRGKTNPKSSTGRLDVFTRVITDESYRFDEIADGYDGQLYLEVVPLSFADPGPGGPDPQPAAAVGRPRRSWTTTSSARSHGEQPLLFARRRTGRRRRPRPRQRHVPQPRPPRRRVGPRRLPGPRQRPPARHDQRAGRSTRSPTGSRCSREDGDRVVLTPAALLPADVGRGGARSRRRWPRR